MNLIIENKFLGVVRRLAKGLLLLSALPFSSFSSFDASAFNRDQSNLGRRIEEERNKMRNKSNTGKRESPVRGERPASKSRRPRRKGRSPYANPTAHLLDVTFTTDAAGASIYIDTVKIGETDGDGKLTSQVRSGFHTIVAGHSERFSKPQAVTIGPGNTNFSFNLSGEGTLPAVRVSGRTATAPSPSPLTKALEMHEPSEIVTSSAPAAEAADASPDEIIERFRDPQQSSSVTMKEWEQVRLQTSALQSQDPGDAKIKAMALFAEGQIAYLRKDYVNAVVLFNNAALMLPNSDLAYYGLGNAYLMTNQPGEAIRAYNRAIELNKDFAFAYKGKGDALSRQGKTDDALKEFGRARALGYAPPEGSTSMAQTLIKKRRWAEALSELELIAEKKPSAEVFIMMGNCYRGMKKNVSAMQAYRKATELDPRSALAFYKHGMVMYEEREYTAAVESLERALALDPAGESINRADARKYANEAMKKARK